MIEKPLGVSTKRKVFGKNEIRWSGRSEEPPSHLDIDEGLARSFRLVEEKGESKGFRKPQLGALYALLAERSMETKEPITIVMPTGTGKTETMLAAFCESPSRTLILVPSDSLREQMASKFVSLGKLPEFGIVSTELGTPVVALISSGLTTKEEVDEIIGAAGVVIATPQSLRGFSPNARQRLAHLCARLYVDEAHHVAANSWSSLVQLFKNKEIVQFTATPYREDGKHLGGKIIYAYPLRLAQQNKYFSTINYHSIVDFQDPDRALAVAAIGQLRLDLANKYDHILMARVATKNRAKELIKLYEELAPEFNPLRIDSDLSPSSKAKHLEKLLTRGTRVIVCVNMLGEGFDLSSLKIAAIHDPQKSLAVTLQFIGRFTRVGGESLGEASAFVPLQVDGIDDRLRKLYGEDADWNLVIRDLTEHAVGSEKNRSEFESHFQSLPSEIALRSIRPKMSTVTYQSATLDWAPEKIYELFDEQLFTSKVGINNEDKVVWWVSAERTPIIWGEFADFCELIHHLYIVHCDEKNGFLYVNSSNNDSLHDEIAIAVGGDDVELLSGEQVYRVLSKVNRRVPTNVGLLDAVSRTRRFSMHVGQDVLEAWKGEGGTKMKTNIFAHGFSGGQSVSFGASRKGRVWSHQVASDIHDWVNWVKKIGPIITDPSIEIAEVMAGFLIPEPAKARPPYIPLLIEWPHQILATLSESRRVTVAGQAFHLIDTDLKITQNISTGDIIFEILTKSWRLSYKIVFRENDAPGYIAVNEDAVVETNKVNQSLSSFFTKHGLHLTFDNETVLTADGYLLKPRRERHLFSIDSIETFDWSGINIRRESQGVTRDPNTVQFRTIEILKSKDPDWEIILDDDGSGELADIVFMRRPDLETLEVLFVHCKFSSENMPGARIADLYDVCGQAMKMNRAKSVPELLTRRLLRREETRQKAGRTGLEKGTHKLFASIVKGAKLRKLVSTVAIVQPGILKASISDDMRALLGATERFLSDTHGMKLRVIGSEASNKGRA
jgi:superfamily II DNA or RNA helicase